MTVTLSEWTTALRSGEYEQGHGELITQNDQGDRRYCCLGVYEQLRAEKGLAVINYRPDRGRCEVISFGDPLHESSEFVLTNPARKELEFPDTNPEIHLDQLTDVSISELMDDPRDDYRDLDWSLASLNDCGFTFDQMADVIDYFFGGEK